MLACHEKISRTIFAVHIWLHILFDTTVSGGLDGTWNGKRYFSCPNGRGIFIQPQDIVNVLSKKVKLLLLVRFYTQH